MWSDLCFVLKRPRYSHVFLAQLSYGHSIRMVINIYYTNTHKLRDFKEKYSIRDMQLSLLMILWARNCIYFYFLCNKYHNAKIITDLTSCANTHRHTHTLSKILPSMSQRIILFFWFQFCILTSSNLEVSMPCCLSYCNAAWHNLFKIKFLRLKVHGRKNSSEDFNRGRLTRQQTVDVQKQNSNEFISAARSKFPSNKLYSKVLFVRLSLLTNSYSCFHD